MQPSNTGKREPPAIGSALKTPRAAALAGCIFSLLLLTSLWILQRSTPDDPRDTGLWLAANARGVALALNLIPFAGIAFLWFIGVLRDRLGAKEDRFVATVFLGSGLLFLAMLFAAAAAGGGLILAYGDRQGETDTAAFAFGRAFTFYLMGVYAFRMAAVFMITSSTLVLYTKVAARWIAVVGYLGALFLLVGGGHFRWTLFVFPIWVLLVSLYILFDNFHTAKLSD